MREFIVFTIPISSKLTVPHGDANGYVAVPPGSNLWGFDCDEINEQINQAVRFDRINNGIHGGLTFANQADQLYTEKINCHVTLPEDFDEWYVYGFDTVHPGDNPEIWPLSWVEFEASKLKFLLEKLELKSILRLNTVWKNNKSGDFYLVQGFPVYNATTNAPTEKQKLLVFYSPISNQEEKWIREAKQFLEKFTYVETYENYLQKALLNYNKQEGEK
jgi:hypothetical protein